MLKFKEPTLWRQVMRNGHSKQKPFTQAVERGKSLNFPNMNFIRRFCSVSFLAVLVASSSLGAVVPIKDLSENLTGARIVRILPAKNSEDEAHINNLRDFFIDTFEHGYDYMFETVFKNLDRTALSEKFKEAFKESTIALKTPNSEQDFFLLEAVDLENNKTVGTASFKKIDGANEVYLYNFAATFFRNEKQRGVGRQLLLAIIDLLPHTDTVHLVVRKQHSRAIAVYEHWGFEMSSYFDPKYLKTDFPGMTLKGEKFRKFFKKAPQTGTPQ